MNHSAEEMSSSVEVPDGLEKALLEPGTEAIVNATHIEGMDGATAIIDSAEEITIYMVDFVTTDTEEEVQNHKWIIESELSPVE